MLNPFKEVNWHPDTAARKSFGTSLIIGFPILAAILFLIKWMKSGPAIWPLWMALAGAGVGLVCRAIPSIALPFYRVWFGFGCTMGFIISNIVISAIYYLVLTPVGLLLRATGNDPMERKFEPGRKSYWKDAEKVTDSERYFRQY